MEKLSQIYEGRYKRIYKTEDESRYLIEYKDDVPVFGVERRYSEGMINNKVTNHFMRLLEEKGMPRSDALALMREKLPQYRLDLDEKD